MIPEKKFCVVIVAGGKGLRAGGELPKQFQLIGDKPMLMHTIEAFYLFDYRMRIIVVLHPDYLNLWNDLCQKHNFNIACTVVEGGKTRFHSVKNGLSAVSDDETVGIHDAARPFVSKQVIGNAFNEAFEYRCGVIPVIDEKNSVRLLSENSSEPIDRERLKLVQTPQVFPAHLLKKAYETAFKPEFTDDASVAEAHGIAIRLVQGNEENIKITTPFDMRLAELLIRE